MDLYGHICELWFARYSYSHIHTHRAIWISMVIYGLSDFRKQHLWSQINTYGPVWIAASARGAWVRRIECHLLWISFCFFITFLCQADWGEGGKICEPCANYLCRSGTEYCLVKNTLLLLPKRTINPVYTGDHINPDVSILIRMYLYVVSICYHN